MYFLTILASLSLSTMVPRALRTNLAVRLIMPCRLPWAATFTLPEAVILKRFLAPLLVFSLGIERTPLLRQDASFCNGTGTARCQKHQSRHGMPRRATCGSCHKTNPAAAQGRWPGFVGARPFFVVKPQGQT